MFFKKTTIIAALSLALPLSAFALNVSNDTNEPSTVRLTTGTRLCSGIDKEHGITRPHQMNHEIPQATINKLCAGSPNKKCGADIYMTDNCTGDVVEHAILDMSNGTVTIEHRNHPRYQVTQNGPNAITSHYR